jgi:hypothetical protein
MFPGSQPKRVWIVGDSHIHWAARHALEREGVQLGLEGSNMELTWKGRRGARLRNVEPLLEDFLGATESGLPNVVIFHLGCNDLVGCRTLDFHIMVRSLIQFCSAALPGATLIWSSILPRPFYFKAAEQKGMNQKLREVNRDARKQFIRAGGKAITYRDIDPRNGDLYRPDALHLSSLGLDIFINILKGALEFFELFSSALVFPRPDVGAE